MSDCIFCKIIAGQIPSKKLYEDDQIYVFHDIHPAAKVHFLIVPKKHVASLAECTAADAGDLSHIFLKAPELARMAGLDQGFRTIINTGQGGGQEVYHLHVHILGGSPMKPLSALVGE